MSYRFGLLVLIVVASTISAQKSSSAAQNTTRTTSTSRTKIPYRSAYMEMMNQKNISMWEYCKGSKDSILRRPHEISEKNIALALIWSVLAFMLYFGLTKLF